jgi:hypothetical protein
VKPARKKVKINLPDEDEPMLEPTDPDVLFADDDLFSFYALVLVIDESPGRLPADDRLHVSMDAAYVGWYRQQINTRVFPPVIPALNTVAQSSGCRWLNLVLTVPDYQDLNRRLTAQGQPLSDSSWWLITPFPYGLRATILTEVFLPAAFSVDPATVATGAARQTEMHLLPRLLIPRNLFAQRLFSAREKY